MEFQIEYDFDTEAQNLYNAWLNAEQHTEMTGGVARISEIVGENFTAWDEYISGKNLILKPYVYIKQSWRTIEFPAKQEDSILELFIEELDEGHSHIKLIHSNLTNSKADKAYERGWIDSYFIPMATYFNQ